jgi:hypothetical protein
VARRQTARAVRARAHWWWRRCHTVRWVDTGLTAEQAAAWADDGWRPAEALRLMAAGHTHPPHHQ